MRSSSKSDKSTGAFLQCYNDTCVWQGPHSHHISCVFAVFSLPNWKFSLCQFKKSLTILYVKLTKKNTKNPRQTSQYPVYSESGSLQLEQTKFPFLAKLPNSLCFPCQGIFVATFLVFPLQLGPWHGEMKFLFGTRQPVTWGFYIEHRDLFTDGHLQTAATVTFTTCI